jgi:hypothetical protein
MTMRFYLEMAGIVMILAIFISVPILLVFWLWEWFRR